MWSASALNETGFNEESIRRNPAADLGGGTFFCVSDSLGSAAEIVFGLGGKGVPLTADSYNAFRCECALKFVCCTSDCEERPLCIVVTPTASFSALILWPLSNGRRKANSNSLELQSNAILPVGQSLTVNNTNLCLQIALEGPDHQSLIRLHRASG